MGEDSRTENSQWIHSGTTEEYQSQDRAHRCGFSEGFVISQSKTQAESTYCASVGNSQTHLFATLCQMVGGTDITQGICFPTGTLSPADVQLGSFQFPCESQRQFWY